MVTTMTLPVFNISVHVSLIIHVILEGFKEGIQFQSNQSLAGVVGVDIPVSAIQGFEPRRALGPSGYTFAMNQVSADARVFALSPNCLP